MSETTSSLSPSPSPIPRLPDEQAPNSSLKQGKKTGAWTKPVVTVEFEGPVKDGREAEECITLDDLFGLVQKSQNFSEDGENQRNEETVTESATENGGEGGVSAASKTVENEDAKQKVVNSWFGSLSTAVVQAIFGDTNENAPRSIASLKLLIRSTLPSSAVGHISNGPTPSSLEVHISGPYLHQYNTNHIAKETLFELEGVLWHELALVWSFDGEGTVPAGLKVGLADYWRLRAGFGGEHWRRKEGGRWDQGFDVTAFFLEWIEGKGEGGKGTVDGNDAGLGGSFVRKLNMALAKRQWSEDMFKELTGKTREELWVEYQEFVKSEADKHDAESDDKNSSPTTWPSPVIKVENKDAQGSGKLFNVAISHPVEWLTAISQVVLMALYTHPQRTPRHIKSLQLIVRDMDGVAYCTGEKHKEIHLSTSYLSTVFKSRGESVDELILEINGVIWHEMVHVWQWNGRGKAPGGVIEGVADYVRLEAGLAPPHWKREKGGTWDSGYSTTAYFLEWVERGKGEGKDRCINFVKRLNLAMKAGWDVGFFEVITGVDVEELWKEYQKSLE
ncbi:hypothetical protein HK102_000198 [Quaeritorhiza haematococci]|nr:hypothetical protein HK102_000198 [Quaeritorhiza haematococci]